MLLYSLCLFTFMYGDNVLVDETCTQKISMADVLTAAKSATISELSISRCGVIVTSITS